MTYHASFVILEKQQHYKLSSAALYELTLVHLTQVAQLATIAHLGASNMFGDTIIYDAQRQVTLNLKQ